MITVYELEEVKGRLIDIYPDAIRGSKAKSYWGKGRKILHLTYGFSSDTAFGSYILAKGDLYYFYEWDTNHGRECLFAESNQDELVERIIKTFGCEIKKIERPVRM